MIEVNSRVVFTLPVISGSIAYRIASKGETKLL